MWDVVDTPRKEFLGAYVSLAHALSIDGDGYGRSFDNKEAGQPAITFAVARHDWLAWR
jgi:hypothetical protein